MFCSGCGQAMEPGHVVCPKCGRPLAPAVPPVPGLQFLLESYAGKIRVLSIFWFAYAPFSVAWGLFKLTFAKAFMAGALGPWMRGPMPPMWFGPAFIHVAWVMLILWAGLAIAAGWGLMEHAQWGRLVAIVAAIFGLLRFPFGTALSIWTLVMLLGYRNSTLYDQL